MSDREDKAPSFPAGTFRGIAEWESVRIGWNNDKTSEQISIRIRCLDEYPDTRGKSILWFGSFANQQAIDITTKALRTLGWDGKSPIAVPDGKNGALAGLGGAEIEFVVKHESYQGKTRAKVAFINAIGAGFEFKTVLNQTDLGKLNERVRRHMASTADERPAARVTQRETRLSTETPARNAPLTLTDEQRLAAIDRGDESNGPTREPGEDEDEIEGAF